MQFHTLVLLQVIGPSVLTLYEEEDTAVLTAPAYLLA